MSYVVNSENTGFVLDGVTITKLYDVSWSRYSYARTIDLGSLKVNITGEIVVKCRFEPEDKSHVAMIRGVERSSRGESLSVNLTLPDAQGSMAYGFTGFVSDFTIRAGIGDVYDGVLTFKIAADDQTRGRET